MSKIIAYREDTWMDRITDYRQWNDICRSYAVDFELLERNEDVVATGVIVVVDQMGVTELGAFMHPVDCTYIFGRTGMNTLIDMTHDSSIKIETPESISLFGVVAAAILLDDRMRKL